MAYRCNRAHRLTETCETCTKEDWRAWHDDYRSERPDVTCAGCGTHYPRGTDEGNATYIGYSLKSCGECQRISRREKSRQDHFQARLASRNGIRKIHRDVAVRYIERFGGSTFVVQTEIDDCEIYLRNCLGLTIATVSMFDKFPKPPENIVDDLPY